MSSGSMRVFGLVSVVVFAALSACAGDYADDWPHDDYSSFASVSAYDVAAKPGTDTVGFVLCEQGGCFEVHYYERDSLGQTLGGWVFSPQEGTYNFVQDVSLAYTSTGTPAIAVAYVVFDVFENFPNQSRIRIVYLTPDTPAWTCTYIDCEEDHRFDVDLFTLPSFRHVDLAFDKRPGYVDEAHIVAGAEWDYLTEEQYNWGEDSTHRSLVFAYKFPSPSYPNAWTGRAVLQDVYGRGVAPPVSLATSPYQAPQVVFGDGYNHGEDLDDQVFCYGQWDSGWPIAGSLEYEPFYGHAPSLAVDPDSGEPRVAFSRYASGDRYLYMVQRDSGSWSAPQLASTLDWAVWPALAIGKYGNNTIVKVVYAGAGVDHPIYVSERVSGSWSPMSPYGRVSYEGDSFPRIALHPGAASDPWVLTVFEGTKVGLAWYGTPPGGCGADPLTRGYSGSPSVLKALIPLGFAGVGLMLWGLCRKRRSVA